MKLFKSTRFRLRTMLLAVAVVAATAYLVREWYLLRDTRQQFDFAWAGWRAGHATDENVVLTSDRLMKAEVGAPWISVQGARQAHVQRLNRLLESIESDTMEGHPDTIARRADYVRGEIDKYRSPQVFAEDP